MVAWLENRDGAADLIDDADAFMTQNAAGLTARQIALEDMQIGAADRGFVILTIASVGAMIAGFGQSSSELLADCLIDERFHGERSVFCGLGARARLLDCVKNHSSSTFQTD